MANLFSRFKKWLVHERRFRLAWFAEKSQPASEPEDALAHLPDKLAGTIREAANGLPVHPCEKETILAAVETAITRWQEQPHLASNSIVILAHPVSSVSRILVESLSEMRRHVDAPLNVQLLDWAERPADLGSLKQQIKEKLDLLETEGSEAGDREVQKESAGGDRTSKSAVLKKHLAVIPNLCWCFLRSAEGLDGIDYLQDALVNNRRQFWIIGSGQVGWKYLKSTLKVHAYCGEVVPLPALTGEQLQQWLEPIIKKFSIRFSNTALHKRFQNSDSLLKMDLPTAKPAEVLSEISQEISATLQSSVRAVKGDVLETSEAEPDATPKYDYFERLADISDGVSIVALQLFLKSLRYQKASQADIPNQPKSSKSSKNSKHSERSKANALKNASESTNESAEKGNDYNARKADGKPDDAEERVVVATVPKLLPLPDFSQSDLYLLYSLMLHGDLTIRALANSLGDAPQVVTNQVQMLCNADVIEQKDGIVKINSMHYPKLRRELARNNFIIEVS